MNHPNRSKQQQQPTHTSDPYFILRLAIEGQRDHLKALNADLLAALKVALPYVERVADTTPTEMNRQQRQRQACTDAGTVRAAIAKAGGK